jgi:hypothetical protein
MAKMWMGKSNASVLSPTTHTQKGEEILLFLLPRLRASIGSAKRPLVERFWKPADSAKKTFMFSLPKSLFGFSANHQIINIPIWMRIVVYSSRKNK